MFSVKLAIFTHVSKINDLDHFQKKFLGNRLLLYVEMNCKESKIRTLTETSINKKGEVRTTRKDGKWQKANSNDIEGWLEPISVVRMAFSALRLAKSQ